LVTEVLELGRRDRATRERLEWQAFSQSFHDEFVLHDPTAAFRVLMEGDNLAFTFDRGHLHRVLWNLLVNALRHASEGRGSVRVVATAGGGRQTTLDVIDDGPGISDTLRGQIFEPFVTSHGTGTGLGLYIARELCEANGAALQLVGEGESQSGAHFRITLEAA
jgi:two-component system sensor histidine kinase PilS (NtrC family)